MDSGAGPVRLNQQVVVVDASVWASRLMPQDTNYSASLRWVRRYTDSGGLFAAPALLLIEVAAAVTRQTKQPVLAHQSVAFLSSVVQMQIMPLDSLLVQTSANLAADLSLRAGDAVYVAVALQTGFPLVTWDREQLLRSSSLVAGFTPDSFPF